MSERNVRRSAKTKASVTINEIYTVYPSAKRVTKKQLDVLQRELGAELPRGYREIVTRFGHGWINDWLAIFCPDTALLQEQREGLLRRFEEYSRAEMIHFHGAKLTEEDIKTCIQIGNNQDMMRLIACRRFPGSAFAWDNLDITQLKAGVEVLDPFGMQVPGFAYYIPVEPLAVYRSLACHSKRLEVREVIQAIEDRCKSPVRVIDVDEGPGLGTRTPCFWVFSEKLGVKITVYGVETARDRRVYLTFVASPKHLLKVEGLIEKVSGQVGAEFKPAAWY